MSLCVAFPACVEELISVGKVTAVVPLADGGSQSMNHCVIGDTEVDLKSQLRSLFLFTFRTLSGQDISVIYMHIHRNV